MKSSLCSVVVLTFLVGQSWSQRPRERPAPAKQQQHHQQAPADDELTDECPEPNGYFADGYQCDKYYECKEGAITEKLCPDGMVFNDYSTMYEKCDLPFNIDCTQRSLRQDPQPSTNCPRQNGYFAHSDPTICDKFYFCVDGKFNMITCPAGLVYNEKTGICTWPDEAKKKHCSSQAREEKVRTRRVAFWKSDEDTSNDMSDEEEDSVSYDDSGSVERNRKRKPGSLDYGSEGSAEYPTYGDSSGSKEPNYDNSYDNYESYDDPAFSNFDQDFQNFVNSGSSGMSYPGLSPHDFIRRKKDNVDELDDLDEYISGYVNTIGKDPKLNLLDRPDHECLYCLSFNSLKPPPVPREESKSVGSCGDPNDHYHQLAGCSSAEYRSWDSPLGTLQTPLVVREVFKFDCPKVDEMRAQQHPRYPDPEDCQFFYVCINGEVPRRNGCKLGQVFNEVTGSCDWSRNVPECKDWYKGVLTDEELEALENPKPKVRNSNYTTAAQKRKRPHQS